MDDKLDRGGLGHFGPAGGFRIGLLVSKFRVKDGCSVCSVQLAYSTGLTVSKKD